MSTFGVILLGMLALVEIVVVGGSIALASKAVREGSSAGAGCSSILATLVLMPTLFVNGSILAAFNSQGSFWAKFALVFGLPTLLGMALTILGAMASRPVGQFWRGVYSLALFGTMVFALWLLFAAAREYPLVLAFDPLTTALLSLVGIPLALVVILITLGRLGIRTGRGGGRGPSDDEATRYIPPDRTSLN